MIKNLPPYKLPSKRINTSSRRLWRVLRLGVFSSLGESKQLFRQRKWGILDKKRGKLGNWQFEKKTIGGRFQRKWYNSIEYGASSQKRSSSSCTQENTNTAVSPTVDNSKNALEATVEVDKSYRELKIIDIDNSDVLTILSLSCTKEKIERVKEITNAPEVYMTIIFQR